MKSTVIGPIVVALLISPIVAQAELLCWSNERDGIIECANPDGTGRFALVSGLDKPQGLALDQSGLAMFWAEHDANQVMRASLAVGAPTTVVAQLPVGYGLRGMAIAPSIGKVYWVAETSAKIQRCNFDGTAVEDLAIPAGSFFDVTVDDTAGLLYWTNGTEIWRGALDGSAASPIISGATEPYYVALDLQAGKMYWTDFAENEIERANLDGSGREVPAPITGLVDRPLGVAFNPVDQKVYWTLDNGTVQRADSNGSNVETIVSDILGTWDIAVVPALAPQGQVPAASTWGIVIMGLTILVAGTLATSRSRKGSLAASGRW